MEQENKFLQRKEAKKIIELIKKQWGADASNLLDEYFFIQSGNDINIISRDIAKQKFEELRINSIGIYFGELKNEIRLSIEGSQLIGEKAQKNIIELNEQEIKAWMKGEEIETKQEGYLLVKHKNFFAGCGRAKEGKLINFVPKERRIHD